MLATEQVFRVGKGWFQPSSVDLEPQSVVVRVEVQIVVAEEKEEKEEGPEPDGDRYQ